MKKGNTLIEVLVAVSIFTVIFSMSIGLFVSISSLSLKQKEYTYFESICLDIDKYYDAYGLDWDNKYYGAHYEDGSIIYYDESYQISSQEKAMYKLEYSYNDNELIINIKNYNSDKFIIENLEYGVSKSYES